MSGKSIFTDEQRDILRATARRIWLDRFKKQGKTQEEFALSLGISQQSASALIRGEYNPGLKPAKALANLEGTTLEQLIGDYAETSVQPGSGPTHHSGSSTFKNLDICIGFYASSKHWSAWTVAAARAGFFGQSDFAPPEWAGKLDALEKSLERARKAG
jgi:transcriptional regulator with XRE-family HTH domain